jgi:hypothetical protein
VRGTVPRWDDEGRDVENRVIGDGLCDRYAEVGVVDSVPERKRWRAVEPFVGASVWYSLVFESWEYK